MVSSTPHRTTDATGQKASGGNFPEAWTYWGTGPFDRVALLLVVGVIGGLLVNGVRAARSEVAPGGIPATVYFVFAAVATMAAAGDARIIARGGLVGTARIARHLWRMCTALFIAVASFFLGQPQVFPDALRNAPGLRAVPVFLVLGTMVFWMIRVRSARVVIPGR